MPDNTCRIRQALSRRGFLQKAGVLCSVSAASGSRILLGQDENTGPIDCGPPPKAKPQSQTGGGVVRAVAPASHTAAEEREEASAQSSCIDRQSDTWCAALDYAGR